MNLKLILFFMVIRRISSTKEERYVFQGCHPLDKNKINVHLIPHSHNEVGWLKTVDQYYTGMNTNVGVQYILTSVLEALLMDKTRRFIQVETAFFWRWWQEQSEEVRRQYTSLVENGQIEMVGGGWVMNDESCTNYQSIIEQMTLGLRIINDTFGAKARPTIGWQIGTFGHSRHQAYLFNEWNYDALFLAHVSTSLKDEMKRRKSLQFSWEISGFSDKSLFTHVFSTDSYLSPEGFCWDFAQCQDDFIDNDPNSFDFNLPAKLKQFDAHIEEHRGYYKNNQIMFGMGGDFQYQEAEINFMNLDKLINAYKHHDKYNVFYSTPSCYVKAVKEEHPHLEFPNATGDLLPYIETVQGRDIFWTGYFTSRPTLKRFERTGNNILQGVKQLNAHAKMGSLITTESYEKNVGALKEALSTIQHHQAITGTEKQDVANDYVRMLTAAIKKAEAPIGYILGNILKKHADENITLPISLCLLTNMTLCDNSLKDKFMVVLYNPLAMDLTHYVRLPAQKARYRITGPDGELAYDLVLPMKYHVDLPMTPAEAEIIFAAKIARMGATLIYVEKLDACDITYNDFRAEDSRTFGNSRVNFTLGLDNLLQRVSMHNVTLNITQQLMFYASEDGTGAYVFEPAKGTSAFPINSDGNETKPTVTYFRGTLVDEVVQKYNNWASQTIRVYKDPAINSHIELDWMVGPLEAGREVISRFFVKDFHNDHFYTDSNGRDTIERRRRDQLVAPNYYPVTSKIQIIDQKRYLKVSVLTDRSQGGSSLRNGEIELMLHRRLNSDDGKGVDEVLEEMEFYNYLVARGQHYLTLRSFDRDAFMEDDVLALKKLLQPLAFVGDATTPDWSLINTLKKVHFKWSALLDDPFPKRIHILSFEPWKGDTYLLRLQNIINDAEIPRDPETLRLNWLFSRAHIKSLRLTNLAANEWQSETIYVHSTTIVELEPMEILTCIVNF